MHGGPINMLNFFSRFLAHPNTVVNSKDGFAFPNLVLGKDKKGKQYILPIKKKTRQNHLILTPEPTNIEERVLKRYIYQDLRYYLKFHSNESIIAINADWNNPEDSLQPYFVNGLALVDATGKLSRIAKRDAIDIGVPDRDVYYFDPLDAQSSRINLMDMDAEIITDFLCDIIFRNSDSDNKDQRTKRNWILRLVKLEQVSGILVNKEPSIAGLLELFRNPTAIMDLFHYLSDNLDKFQNNEDKKALVDDFESHFRLGDTKQNEINFDLYSLLSKYFEKNKLGKYLIDNDRPSGKINRIVAQGGICLFNLNQGKLNEYDTNAWSKLICSALLNAVNNKFMFCSPQFPIYLTNFDSYLNEKWFELFRLSVLRQSPITLHVSSLAGLDNIANSEEDTLFPTHSVYGDMRTLDLKSITANPNFLMITTDKENTLINQLSTVSVHALVTKLSYNKRVILRF